MTVKFKETLEQLAQGESRNLIKSFSDFQTVVRIRKEKAAKIRQLQTVVREMSVKFKETLEQLAQGESRNLIKSFSDFQTVVRKEKAAKIRQIALEQLAQGSQEALQFVKKIRQIIFRLSEKCR